MKTTIEIPNELFRQAKAKAALEGIRLKDLITQGLRLALQKTPKSTAKKRVKFPILKSRSKKPLDIPDDAAFRAAFLDDVSRYEASLR